MRVEDIGFLSPEEDRRAGAILGLAVGDALGARYEFDTADEVPEGPLEILGGGWLNLAPGETTDDTALARAVLLGYQGGSLNLQRVREEMLRWEESGPPDIGNQTSIALDYLSSHPEALSLPDQPHAQGNGAVMRSASHGIKASSPRQAVENAWNDASLTHPSRMARASSALVAGTTAYLIGGLSPANALESSFVLVEAIDEGQESVRVSFPLPDIEDVLKSYPGDRDRWGWAIHTTRLALGSLLNAADFRSGVESVVRLGGDADTNAAVAGALLGARFGAASIPTEWVDTLRGKDDLLELM